MEQRVLENRLQFNGSLSARRVNETWGNDGFFDRALTMNPTMPVYNADGSYYQPTSPTGAHEISVGPYSLRPNAFKISFATFTSFTGSPVKEMRNVSPMPSASKAPIPTADLIIPVFTVPASVMPK